MAGPVQLVCPFPDADGRGRFALACSKDLERGARATLLMAPGLFRLDVTPAVDTLRTVVRNLSQSELTMDTKHHNEPGTNLVVGEAALYEPARAAVSFTLRSAREQIDVSVTIGTLLLEEHGTIRVSAQAIMVQRDVA